MGLIRIVVQRKVLCVEDWFFGWNYEYLEFIRCLAFRRENFREKNSKILQIRRKILPKKISNQFFNGLSKISFLDTQFRTFSQPKKSLYFNMHFLVSMQNHKTTQKKSKPNTKNFPFTKCCSPTKYKNFSVFIKPNKKRITKKMFF